MAGKNPYSSGNGSQNTGYGQDFDDEDEFADRRAQEAQALIDMTEGGLAYNQWDDPSDAEATYGGDLQADHGFQGDQGQYAGGGMEGTDFQGGPGNQGSGEMDTDNNTLPGQSDEEIGWGQFVEDDVGAGVDMGYESTGNPYDDMIARLDEMIQAGPRDTAEDEALIEEFYNSRLGGGTADLMARMGAAGFGQSGAQVGMAGDLQRSMARDAQADIMGLRDDARDDWRADLNAAAGNLFNDRRQDNQESYQDNVASILEQMLGGSDEEADPEGVTDWSGGSDGTPGSSGTGGVGPFNLDSVAAGPEAPDAPAEGPGSNAQPIPASLDDIPMNDERRGNIRWDQLLVSGGTVQGDDGKWYEVSGE